MKTIHKTGVQRREGGHHLRTAGDNGHQLDLPPQGPISHYMAAQVLRLRLSYDLIYIFHHYFPLTRFLRSYGHDKDIFSFECGRRCPTGEGVYVFKCSKAEQLFRTLLDVINSATTLNASNGAINVSVNCCSAAVVVVVFESGGTRTAMMIKDADDMFSSFADFLRRISLSLPLPVQTDLISPTFI